MAKMKLTAQERRVLSKMLARARARKKQLARKKH